MYVYDLFISTHTDLLHLLENCVVARNNFAKSAVLAQGAKKAYMGSKTLTFKYKNSNF